MLGFLVSEHSHGEMYKSLVATSKEVQFTSYLEEKGLGFIKVLYGRYAKVTATLVLCSLNGMHQVLY